MKTELAFQFYLASQSPRRIEILESLGYRFLTLSAVGIGMEKDDGRILVSKTAVSFAKLSDSDIDAYCQTGEPLDRAGAYGIQGRAGGWVKEIKGSYTGVMGLPVYETVELLKIYRINLF